MQEVMEKEPRSGSKIESGLNCELSFIKDGDIEVIKKWFSRFTVIPAIMNKYVLRHSPKELL